MSSIVNDIQGGIHLIASLAALFSGTSVLMLRKGSTTHIRFGYFYLVSMLILLLTAFMIYRLYSGWGIFHYMALLSALTLMIGVFPVFLRRRIGNWGYLHFTFMYWSVIGLYSAFVAEIITRIPESPFYEMLGVAIGGCMLLGTIFFGVNKQKWKRTFVQSRN